MAKWYAKGIHLISLLFAINASAFWFSEPKKTCASQFQTQIFLSFQWIEQQSKALTSDSLIQKKGYTATLANPDILKNHNTNYTKVLKTPPIASQKKSGRCWAFASSAMFSSMLTRSPKVPKDFELSQNYLNFFQLLETVDLYFSRVENKLKNRIGDDSEMNGALDPDMIDSGGSFQLFSYIIKKYGIVPSSLMPETPSSQNELYIIEDLREKALKYAHEMAKLTNFQGKLRKNSVEQQQVRQLREKALRDVFTMLVAHYGRPPLEFSYNGENWTPLTMADNYISAKELDGFVVVESDPSQNFNAYYKTKREKYNPKYTYKLNLPYKRFEALIKDSIDAEIPIYLGSNFSHRDIDVDGIDKKPPTGIMHPDLFQKNIAYGFDNDLSRMNLPYHLEIKYGNTASNHAMLIIGYDQPPGAPRPIKYLVQNSHGEKSGDKGFLHMYVEWFAKNGMRLVIHKSLLTAKELELLKNPK